MTDKPIKVDIQRTGADPKGEGLVQATITMTGLTEQEYRRLKIGLKDVARPASATLPARIFGYTATLCLAGLMVGLTIWAIAALMTSLPTR